MTAPLTVRAPRGSLTPEQRKERKREFDRAQYLANREKRLEAARAAYWANPEAKKAYAAAYQKAQTREKRAQWRANASPEARANKRARNRERYEAKRELLLAQSREYHYGNHEERLAQKRAWAAANRHRGAYYAAKRRALIMRATPAWATEFYIEEAYHLAAVRSAATESPWEVDHIVPLDSPYVCGLHCEANLRVVPRRVNRAKGNRDWPDA